MNSKIILSILTIWVLIVFIYEQYLFNTENIYSKKYFPIIKSQKQEDLISKNNFVIHSINSSIGIQIYGKAEKQHNSFLSNELQEISFLSTTKPQIIILTKGIYKFNFDSCYSKLHIKVQLTF